MLFQKWGCLVGPENRIFQKLISVDRKKIGFDYGNHFTLSFSLQSISGERERERESERAIVDDRAPVQSDDRRRTPSSSPRRSRKLQFDDRDLAKHCADRDRRGALRDRD